VKGHRDDPARQSAAVQGGLGWAAGQRPYRVPGRIAASCVQAVRGLGIAAMDVATNTLLQRIVPPDLLGRVFGGLYGGIGVAAALAYLSCGLLLDLTTPRVAFLAAGTCGLLATLATAVALGHAAAGDQAHPGPPR
jgi:MFS family permease